jgi:uncharacterized protein YjaG (DUF416 family)
MCNEEKQEEKKTFTSIYENKIWQTVDKHKNKINFHNKEMNKYKYYNITIENFLFTKSQNE